MIGRGRGDLELDAAQGGVNVRFAIPYMMSTPEYFEQRLTLEFLRGNIIVDPRLDTQRNQSSDIHRETAWLVLRNDLGIRKVCVKLLTSNQKQTRQRIR
ncbi:hypothetical protein QE152_g8784 [Popillia japonica]|uniref:Uncharacterized protein n=1 Tax=Popillia japonica TaxID=7064 RepID=A0AAW1LZJ1_POPJA